MIEQGWEPKRPTLPKRCSPPHNAVGVGLFLLVSLYGNVGCLWVLFDMLEEEMGSINRQNDWAMEESVMPILHLEACSTETDQDLRP